MVWAGLRLIPFIQFTITNEVPRWWCSARSCPRWSAPPPRRRRRSRHALSRARVPTSTVRRRPPYAPLHTLLHPIPATRPLLLHRKRAHPPHRPSQVTTCPYPSLSPFCLSPELPSSSEAPHQAPAWHIPAGHHMTSALLCAVHAREERVCRAAVVVVLRSSSGSVIPLVALVAPAGTSSACALGRRVVHRAREVLAFVAPRRLVDFCPTAPRGASRPRGRCSRTRRRRSRRARGAAAARARS